MKLIQDITLGQYMPGNSFIHSLDPRTKLFILIILIATTFGTDDFFALIIISCLILLSVKLATFTFVFVVKGIRLFFWLFLFTAIFHFFFTPGDSIYPFPAWGINLTSHGIYSGITVFLQLFLVVLLANIFTLTTSPGEFKYGMEKILKPLKRLGLNTEDIALMISLVIRFIPLLKEESIKIMNAQRVRGVNFKDGNIAKRAKNIIFLMGPLFMTLLIRTDSLVLAMLARGYKEGGSRGHLQELSFKKTDLISLTLIGFFSLYIFLKY